MEKDVKFITQIFPDFEEKIHFLFQTDEYFRELCTDHLLCADMVRKMKAEKDKNSEKMAEYEDLQNALEQEIIQAISKNTQKNTNNKH